MSRPGTARSSLAKQEDELRGVSAPHSLDTPLEPAATSVADVPAETVGVERLADRDGVVGQGLDEKDDESVIFHGLSSRKIFPQNS
jgi:hypothetical protein